jgi:hypothetical protein
MSNIFLQAFFLRVFMAVKNHIYKIMPRFKGRFVKEADLPKLKSGGEPGEAEGGSRFVLPDEGEVIEAVTTTISIGAHLLVASFVAAVVVIFFIIPEFSYKPTRRARPEDLDPDARVLVPNRLVQLNTRVRKINRITGDRVTLRSQDASQDEIVLAPRSVVTGDYTVMVQGDAVPIHAELLDTVGWLRECECEKKSEELGYLIAI